ncbi:MAG: hypothetical protein EOP09_08900 [Proteobacteria bacterium]|nr:MAG: hypothetical protein EOP09_08900 [Pseudomonadota bacterium]
MSINVHQEGGNPEQAMLGVKSCALNSVEDVARCQEQIAEVMTYASTNFPTQIQNSPGIVSYTTAPLFALGGKTIPAIPQDILAARKDLAAMAKANYQLESMITQSKVKGLPVESAVEDSVSSNKQLIRDAGLTCFQYQIGETALDWSACKVALAQVQATLVPIPSSTVMVHQGAIVGNEMNGYSIYNPYGKKITVNYVIDKDDQWNYGTRANPSFNGVDPSNPNLKQFSKNSVVPDTRQGTLLLRKGDDYETSPNSGSLEIYPGDGVSFLMNDELGKYSDNSGALSISWRCQDCSQSALRPTELLNLSASSADGVTFINRQATQASYSVKAYGLWRNSRSFGFTNSRGYDQICGPSCPMPDEIDQLLVVQTPSESIALGNEGNFTLAPGQKATFIHNDDANSYRDNEGELVLIIQCTNCP